MQLLDKIYLVGKREGLVQLHLLSTAFFTQLSINSVWKIKLNVKFKVIAVSTQIW